MKNEIMTAEIAKSLIQPEEGSSEFFERHKLVIGKSIEKAILENEYECYIEDFDLWIGFEDKRPSIFTYLDKLGYEVEQQNYHGLGIKISWRYCND